MRTLAALLLLALVALAPAATTYDATAVNGDNSASPLSLTSTETTIVLSTTDNGGRYVQIQCDQPWGLANTACTFANKTYVSANTGYTVYLPPGGNTLTIYVQASSSTGVLKIRTIAYAK
jgi:hypothetical protein